MIKTVFTTAALTLIITASATAYTGTGTAYHSCEGSTAITASGKVARVGYVANNFLPLGTWIQMTKPKTVMGRSFFKVMDRGGGSFALDFWAKDCGWMNSWGVHTVSFKALKKSDLYRGLPARGWSLKRSKKGWKFSWSAKLSSNSSSTKAIAAKMPKNWKTWVRIGRCEQPGRGAWGVNWSHPGPRYQGGLGFYSGTWDSFKPRGYPADAGQATWRQQMNVANRVAASVGFSAWGCN